MTAENERTPRHARVEEDDTPATPKPRRWARWYIASQRAGRRDVTVAWHPWEWAAELHAHWLGTRQSRAITGTFYTVYAVKP